MPFRKLRASGLIKISGSSTLEAKLYLPSQEGNFAGVLLSHGFASAIEEFMDFPEDLCQAGYGVLAFNYSGHGKSEGARAYVSSKSHLEDILSAYQYLVNLPQIQVEQTFLVGHSLGTVAVLRLLATRAGKNVLGVQFRWRRRS